MLRVLKRPLFRIAAVAVASTLLTTHARADQLDRVIAHDAGDIVAAATKLGGKKVAVLKFQVQIGTDQPSFRIGTEGAEMVRRLEQVLVQGLDPKAPAYTVLSNAGDAASAQARALKTPGDWTSAEGRRRLFDLTLPVAWDDGKKMAPDAYLTGVVRTTKDMKQVYVDLVGFTRSNPDALVKLGTLAGPRVAGKARGIPMDRNMLASLGQTFSTPRTIPSRAAKSRDLLPPDELAAESAATQNETPATGAPVDHLLVRDVKLKVIYGGTPQMLEKDSLSGGEYKIGVKASTGAPVTFEIENTGPERLAVLLCVNGQNTIAIDNESLVDGGDKGPERFRMYVLDPNKKYTISGFLKNAATGETQKFDVTPEDQASAAFDALKTSHAGKIQMFVYGKTPVQITPGAGSPPEPTPGTNPNPGSTLVDSEKLDTEMSEAFAAADLGNGTRSIARSRSLGAAQKQLESASKLKWVDGKLQRFGPASSRSIIIPGQTVVNGVVQEIAFEYDGVLGNGVITYYSREGVVAAPPAP